MKKTLLSIFIAAAAALSALAVPASRTPFTATCADGSRITLYAHGDEFYHYYTDASGRRYSRNSAGLFELSPITRSEQQARVEAAKAKRAAMSSMRRVKTTGELHFLVILIEFKDKSFSFGKSYFEDMLNTEGYSAFNAPGSARDYFMDNSDGRFKPTFDVVGPIKVSGRMSAYGANDEMDNDIDPDGLLAEACSLAHAQRLVDFSIYDANSDGYVDNILYYYAGYNEAEGASEETIWPHASNVMSHPSYDGVKISSYACTSELRGTSGRNLCGIGTACHEFSHVLGLPDFYDTDYEGNGLGDGMVSFSLMDHGSYNNSGKTPPYYTTIERELIGWGPAPQSVGPGNYTLDGVQNNVAWKLETLTDGECFYLETRNGQGWDSAIGATGLFIYRIDRSSNLVMGRTAASLWDNWNASNALNAVASHQCCAIVPSDPGKYRIKNVYDGAISYSYFEQYIVFPGSSQVSSLGGESLVGFAGTASGLSLSGISFSGGKSSFSVEQSPERVFSGKVTDSSGKGLAGVSITLFPQGSPGITATTASNGNFSINIPEGSASSFTYTISKDGYRKHSGSLYLEKGSRHIPVVLYGITETIVADLQKYGSLYTFLSLEENSFQVAVCFPAEELQKHLGYKFSQMKFLLGGGKSGEVHAFVDFGSERKILRKVDSPAYNLPSTEKFTVVDISGEDLSVPSGTDVYIGYAVKNLEWGDMYPDYAGYNIPVGSIGTPGGGYVAGYGTSAPRNWMELEIDGEYFNTVISATLEEMTNSIDALGIRYILNPRGAQAWKTGDEFPLLLNDGEYAELPVSVEWKFDGQVAGGASVRLSAAGDHTVQAALSYTDGHTELISCILKVE